MRQMDLEPITQSEISPKEKDKYHLLTHIYGIQKDGTYLQGDNRDSDIKKRLMNIVGEGEGGTI